MEQEETPQFERELRDLVEAINTRYNYDFRQYSPKSLYRTLVVGMNRVGCQTLPELQEKVLHSEADFQALVQCLTIAVSEFFRDPSYFLSLRHKVLPLLKTYPSIKLWVAGCSTGEEVYSLAILLEEEGLLERTVMYATDINSRSLEKAEKGAFLLEDIQKADFSYQSSGGTRLLSDYYTIVGNSAYFMNHLKKIVVFTDHSLATDSVFSETHLISCRNVLIYFNRELQDRAIGLFHESLCRKGFLGLGSKETIQFSSYAPLFSSVVKEDRIYQKIS